MSEQIFKYKIVEKNEAGETIPVATGSVFIREIVNAIIRDDKLYLFLKQQNETVQLVRAPVKNKPTKANPNEWVEGLEKRVVTEPLALQITEADDIERWKAFVESIDI